MIRKVLIGGTAAFVVFLFTGGPALAFHCVNASRSENGNAHAANGSALMSIEEILVDPEFVGLCPAGVEHVLEGLEDQGYDTGVLINFHAVMAGGPREERRQERQLAQRQGHRPLVRRVF